MEKLKNILFESQNGICALCKLPMDFKKCTVDHKTPISKGGADTQDNKQSTHSWCNYIKADSTDTLTPTQYFNRSRELQSNMFYKKRSKN